MTLIPKNLKKGRKRYWEVTCQMNDFNKIQEVHGNTVPNCQDARQIKNIEFLAVTVAGGMKRRADLFGHLGTAFRKVQRMSNRTVSFEQTFHI